MSRMIKGLLDIVDYGVTTAEARGRRIPFAVKPLLLCAKVGMFAFASQHDPKDAVKEIAHAGVSTVCGAAGYLIVDRKTAAQWELLGKSAVDVGAWIMQE